jgi:predicted transposase YdaD
MTVRVLCFVSLKKLQISDKIVRTATPRGGIPQLAIFLQMVLLLKKLKVKFETVLFVLKPPSKKAQNLGYYDIAPFGKPMNEHNLAVVKLWELRDAILSGKKEYLGLVPLLPEISLEVDKKLMQRLRELIALVEDPALQAELKFYTVAFLQSYFSQKFLSTFFSEDPKMLEHWEQVPIFGDRIKQRSQEAWEKGLKSGMEEGREKGREEGREEGVILALQQNILDALHLRFGLANGRIARVIQALDDPKKLKVIFRRVVKAESLEAVKKVLESQKQPTKKKVRSAATR